MLEIGWDYFTGSSWLGVKDCVLDLLPNDEIVKRKVMQYDGLGIVGQGGWFTGTALQGDGQGGEFIHHILVASSDTADKLRLADTACLPECRRLDLQVTIPHPGLSLAQWGMALKQKKFGPFNRRGRYPRISLIISDTTTVYIGKRGKRRMVRVYEKTVDERKYLRFELELGNELANHYKGVTKYTTGLAATLLEEYWTLPTTAQIAITAVGDTLTAFANGHRQPRHYPDSGQTNSFGWLLMALHNAQKTVRGGSLTTAQLRLIDIAVTELKARLDAIAL